jgi:hypothetical protein
MNSMIDDNGQKDSNSKKFFKYALKTIAFIVFLTLSPVIFLAIIWIGFKLLVLNDSIDIKPMLEFAASKLKVDKKEEIDISELNEDDIVMVDVEDITDRK